MENASKALIIAGSVLIAIVLIAVGIKILSLTNKPAEQVDKVSSALEVSIYNSQFLQYEGEIKGSEVKALLRLIKQNNIKNVDREIKVYKTHEDEEKIEKTNLLSDYINQISVSQIYSVKFIDDESNGYIKEVEISIDK